MTEPQGGSDPSLLRDHGPARRRRVGHQRVEVLLVQRPHVVLPHRHGRDRHRDRRVPGHVDVPGAHRHARASSSSATSGSWASRPGEGMHALIHYNEVRVPAESLLGGEGQAFAIAQTRLGGGRVHHAMRTVGMAQRALDMMCERALSAARPSDGTLADKQSVQDYRGRLLHRADAVPALRPLRGLGDRPDQDTKAVRKDIAAIKVLTPQVLHDIVQRSHPGPRGARRLQRDAAGRHVDDGRRHGPGRRADRGAPHHGGPPGAQGLPAGRGPLAQPAPAEPASAAAAGEVRRVPRARSGELCERSTSPPWPASWTPTGLPGARPRHRDRVRHRRRLQRSLRRSRRGDYTRGPAQAPRSRAAGTQRDHGARAPAAEPPWPTPTSPTPGWWPAATTPSFSAAAST